MTASDITHAIENLGFDLISETTNNITFRVDGDNTANLNKNELQEILRQLNKYKSNEDIELYNDKTYEVLVRNEKRFMPPRSKEHKQEDLVNKITYRIYKLSNEYLVFFLYNLNKRNATNFLRVGFLGLDSRKCLLKII